MDEQITREQELMMGLQIATRIRPKSARGLYDYAVKELIRHILDGRTDEAYQLAVGLESLEVHVEGLFS